MKRRRFDAITELTIISRSPVTFRVVHQGRLIGRIRRFPGQGWYCQELKATDPERWHGGSDTKAGALASLIATTEGLAA